MILKNRLFSLALTLSLIVSLVAVPVYAEDAEAQTDPAPAAKVYNFDGVQYINAGNNSFSTSQEEYYRAMLNNALNSGDYGKYSITDLWTTIGVEMLARYNGSSQLQNNLFRKEADYFLNSENDLDINDMRVIYADPLNSPEYAPIAHRNIEVAPTFTDSFFGHTGEIDFSFTRYSLRSAATSQAFAESAARIAADRVLDSDGKHINIPDSVPVTVKEDKAPELNGPVYFSLVTASGKDLHLYNQSPYNEKNIHAVAVAFSDFSITPIIPDENEGEPYVYVKTAGGSSSKDEQKIVSDVKNYSGETVSASQTVSESLSSTVTSSISGSQGTSTTNSYGISDTVKVGAKFSLEKLFEVGGEMSTTISEDHSTTETVTKGWSSSEGTTETETNSRTITVPLPPYTTALMSQQHFNSEEMVRYNCPVALNYKVTVYYVYGNLNGNNNAVEISFEKVTDFGASGNAITDLGKRFKQSTNSSNMADADGINWNNFREDSKKLISALSHTVPFDTTQASFTSKIDLVRTNVDDILPIYPINAIKFVNPDSVLYNNPWLTEINMEVGDTDNANNYSLRALNQYGADFYTFYRQNGSFILLDENKNDITEGGNDVIRSEIDAVTGALRFEAIGEGTVYLRYKINDGLYRTADMAASNTPEDYIDDSEIEHPALLRINVTDTEHKHTWLKPRYVWSDDYSTCTAYCKCKYDDTHLIQETSDTESKVVREESCTEGEVIEYTAEFETEGFEPQTASVEKDAPGHTWDAGKVTKKATLTQAGTRVYTCSVCGETKTETIAKLAKKANPLKIKAKTAKVKLKKLNRKAQNLAVTKVISFTGKTNDKKTYTLVSAKKGSKNFKKYFMINKKTGKVTITKNKKMKKGTYKVKIKVKALGNTKYKASAYKTVTFKVQVK